MKPKLRLALFIFLSFPFFVFADQAEKLPVTIDAEQISFLQQEGKIIAEGDVVLEHNQVKIYCQKAIYDAQTNKAKIIGEAKIVRDGTTAYGQDMVYDFNLLDTFVEQVRVSQPPIYGKAEQVKEEDAKYTLREGYVTTCDLDKPHYRLVAKTVTIYPGERVVARNMVLKIGDFPIFYFPYFSQSLKEESFPIELTPGRTSEWGYYLLSRLRYNLDEKNQGRIILDWYEKRGLGMGVNHQLKTKDYGDSILRYYRIQDELHKIEKRQEFSDRYPSRSTDNLKRERYKTQFFYDWQPHDRFFIISELHKFSDKYFMKDFFELEYDIEPEPKSYFLASYSFDHSRLSFFAQKRVNRFFKETEYLPQLEYSFHRQQLGRSNFYFESIDKLGSLRDTERDSADTGDAFRVYSENILSYRNRIAWLSFSPYLGAQTAYYSRDKAGKSQIFRAAAKMGISFRTRLYNTFKGSWKFFGKEIDAFRHIVTPEVNYSNVGSPNVANSQIYQFDKHDDIVRKQRIVFRLHNKLQARNQDRTWDFLYFSPSLEYRVAEQGRTGSRFDNIKADLEIYPVRNISFNSDAQYQIQERHFSKVNANLTFHSRENVLIDEYPEPRERSRYRVSLGHRYTRDSSLGTLGLTYNLTPKLQFRQSIRYEYSTGDLEKQQYALRFDLHCWWMDLGLDLNQHERGGKDTTIWLAFRLKAFPDINVDFSQTFDSAKASY